MTDKELVNNIEKILEHRVEIVKIVQKIFDNSDGKIEISGMDNHYLQIHKGLHKIAKVFSQKPKIKTRDNFEYPYEFSFYINNIEILELLKA